MVGDVRQVATQSWFELVSSQKHHVYVFPFVLCVTWKIQLSVAASVKSWLNAYTNLLLGEQWLPNITTPTRTYCLYPMEVSNPWFHISELSQATELFFSSFRLQPTIQI